MLKTAALKISHSKQRNIYKELFKKHKSGHLALHWSDKKRQEFRFEILSLAGNLHGRSVLDLGCGFGDFFSFLHKKKINGNFVGLDIIDEFLKTAALNNPNCHFENINILSSFYNKKFDYVFSSGLYAFGNRTFFYEMTKEAFSLCNKCYAFNIYKPTYDKKFFYIEKDQVISFSKKIGAKKITYKENYIKNDTTYYLYR